MLSKIESPIKNGNQITGYEYYWAHDPYDLNDEDAKVIGEVSEADLLANPEQALEAWTGTDSTIWSFSEFLDWIEWLVVEHGYSIKAANKAALQIAADKELELKQDD